MKEGCAGRRAVPLAFEGERKGKTAYPAPQRTGAMARARCLAIETVDRISAVVPADGSAQSGADDRLRRGPIRHRRIGDYWMPAFAGMTGVGLHDEPNQ